MMVIIAVIFVFVALIIVGVVLGITMKNKKRMDAMPEVAVRAKV